MFLSFALLYGCYDPPHSLTKEGPPNNFLHRAPEKLETALATAIYLIIYDFGYFPTSQNSHINHNILSFNRYSTYIRH